MTSEHIKAFPDWIPCGNDERGSFVFRDFGGTYVLARRILFWTIPAECSKITAGWNHV